jgi:cation transport ATPase
VSKVPGVSKANVNFAAEKALVNTDGSVQSIALLDAVKKAGYRAEMLDSEEAEAKEKMNKAALCTFLKLVINSFCAIFKSLTFLCL